VSQDGLPQRREQSVVEVRRFVGGSPESYPRGERVAERLALGPATRVLTNTDVLQLLKSGLGEGLVIEKIQTSSCEFKTDPEDITTLHNGNVSDAIIAAMMHAVPVEQGGPTTGIQPVKK
jgi:hypothetical protein